MENTQSSTLTEAVKENWRSFAPAWLFPVVFLYGGAASDTLGCPTFFFFLVALPLFFCSIFLASRPWTRRRIKYWHCVFLALVVPFLVWGIAVFSRLAVLGALSGHGAA